jgi:hypothetical protein
LKKAPSGDASLCATIETGMMIIRNPARRIRRSMINEIRINDRKYLAELRKNFRAEKVPGNFLRLLNIPPERKELVINEISTIINNPVRKYELRLLKLDPRSAKTSILIP